jgi:hypothetical protein
MTRYIAAYDTESRDCFAACQRIQEVHEQFEIPATFFIVGKLLEREGTEYQALLGDGPLFEVASHTYSHRMLRDHQFCGPAVEPADRLIEIERGKDLVEQIFQRSCLGMRPACGFAEGLCGDPWLVDAVAAAGFSYVSSLLWGPETTLPALLVPPFNYAEEGHPEVWELPGHGWHENVLKAHNLADRPRRIVAWPSPFPEGVPLHPISTPEEEFAINRVFIDQAVSLDLPYISLVWHPWSLARFDPGMKTLELTFSYIQDRGLECTTYAAEWQHISAT